MRLRNLPLYVGASLILASCGSEKSSDSIDSSIGDRQIKSQFIDAPVRGLEFKTASQTQGKTGENGSFSCNAGEEVKFLVKGLEIGSASCSSVVYISELTPSSAVANNTDFAAMIIQSFAQTVGDDLDLSALNADSAINFTGWSNPGSEGALTTAIGNKISGSANPSSYEAVTLSEAQEHVRSNLPNQANNTVLANAASKFGSRQILHMKETSGGELCFDNMFVEAKLEAQGSGGRINYKLSVDRLLAFDDDEGITEDDFDTACSGKKGTKSSGDDCLSGLSPKYLSGNSTTFFARHSEKTTYSPGVNQACQMEGIFAWFLRDGETCDGDLIDLDRDYVELEEGFAEINVNFSATGVSVSTSEKFNASMLSNYSDRKFVFENFSGSCSYSVNKTL